MKKCAFILLLVCLIFSCKKEKQFEKPQKVSITGQVTDALTQKPLSGIEVRMVRGTSCCAWIDSVLEGTAVLTDQNGRYTVSMEYEKPDYFVRHMAFVPGYQSKFRLLPSNAGNEGTWHTVSYAGLHAFPESPMDSLPAIAETTSNFVVIQGAWLNAPKSNKKVTTGENWLVEIIPDIQVAWPNNTFCLAGFGETYTFINDIRLPLVANVENKVSLIRVDLNNQVLSRKEFSFTPEQGDVIDFALDF
jgi:hypothetical protein